MRGGQNNSRYDQQIDVENSLEAFHQLDQSTLAATTGADDRDELSRQDLELESTKDANMRTSRVAEVNIVELDVTGALIEHVSRGVLSINVRLGVDDLNVSCCGTLGLGHVLYSQKNSVSLDALPP